MSLPTIEKWCKTIWNISRITLLKPTGRPRTVKIEAKIQNVKHRQDQLRVLSCRKVAHDLRISRTSPPRILKDDLKLQSYRKKIQPKISEDQKEIGKMNTNEHS